MDLIDDPKPGSNTPEFTVGEIAGAVKKLIEGELGFVRIRGEVGRVVLARSGHLYFDLKDDRNVLSCMSWKGQVPGLGVMPEEGMEVVAEGRMTASGFQSKFSLNAQSVTIAGQGALMALLEKRKKALAAEGLFESARKKKLPFLPEVIGVVTSPQGAVIRDILHRLRDRFPRKVLIWPVAVQGQACAPEVARAIEGFNRLTPGGALPRPDLLIVARGGGSIEDLWGFNEEVVARAAAGSDIPLISAVGHETDTTLIDYVSDHRAPTPTAAAERAVPVRLELAAWLRDAEGRLGRVLLSVLQQRQQRLRDLSRAMPTPDRLFESARQRLDRADRLGTNLQILVDRRRAGLAQRAARLSPQVLRGALMARQNAVNTLALRLPVALERASRRASDRLQRASQRLKPQDLRRDIEAGQKTVTQLSAQIGAQTKRRLAFEADRLAALERLRRSLGYEATLQRGYAVVRAEGSVITNSKAAKKASSLEIQFADGRVKVAASDARPMRPRKTNPPPEQGSLF